LNVLPDVIDAALVPYYRGVVKLIHFFIGGDDAYIKVVIGLKPVFFVGSRGAAYRFILCIPQKGKILV
jgi:hypothetical protein